MLQTAWDNNKQNMLRGKLFKSDLYQVDESCLVISVLVYSLVVAYIHVVGYMYMYIKWRTPQLRFRLMSDFVNAMINVD